MFYSLDFEGEKRIKKYVFVSQTGRHYPQIRARYDGKMVKYFFGAYELSVDFAPRRLCNFVAVSLLLH